jgi:oligosaccharide repeat unit polymerase
MSAYAIPVHLFLGFLICGVEHLRRKFHPKLDFLRLVSLLYLIAFCLTPILAYSSGLMERTRSDHALLIGGHWAYFFGAIVSTVGYAAIVLGFYAKEITRPHAPLRRPVRPRASLPTIIRTESLIIAGLGFLLAGIGAMWLYASSLGGFDQMLQNAVAIRGNAAPQGDVPWLKFFMPLTAIASYFFFSAWSTSSKALRWTSGLLFLPAFCGGLLVYYVLSARNTLLTYFFSFIIARIITSKQWNLLGISISIVLFVFVVLFGKSAFHWFHHREALLEQASFMSQHWQRELPETLLREFSFAYLSTANSVGSVPWQTDFRWFLDIPRSILHNVPDRIFPAAELSPNIYKVNTLLIKGDEEGGTIPLGLDAFGYYSFGISGTMIICFIFGLIIRMLEDIFNVERSPKVAILRAAMMLYVMLRVVYADPVFALQDGLALFMGIFTFLALQRENTSRMRGEIEVTARGRPNG